MSEWAAAGLLASWVAVIAIGLWRDLPEWVADAESDDE